MMHCWWGGDAACTCSNRPCRQGGQQGGDATPKSTSINVLPCAPRTPVLPARPLRPPTLQALQVGRDSLDNAASAALTLRSVSCVAWRSDVDSAMARCSLLMPSSSRMEAISFCCTGRWAQHTDAKGRAVAQVHPKLNARHQLP